MFFFSLIDHFGVGSSLQDVAVVGAGASLNNNQTVVSCGGDDDDHVDVGGTVAVGSAADLEDSEMSSSGFPPSNHEGLHQPSPLWLHLAAAAAASAAAASQKVFHQQPQPQRPPPSSSSQPPVQPPLPIQLQTAPAIVGDNHHSTRHHL